MAKELITNVKGYSRNVLNHIGNVLRRKESLSDAWQDLALESKKLKAALEPEDNSPNHVKAVQLVKVGRLKYNTKDYPSAERCFRSAILEDPKYALAITFLGHTLYKMGRYDDAVVTWQRAYATDPNSDAGQKALEKLERVKHHTYDVIAQLEAQVRQSR